MQKEINTLHFERKCYPDVVALINRLARFEHRKPHDVAKRLILDGGQRLLQQYESNTTLPNVG